MERKTDYQGQEKHECVKPAVNRIETRYMEAGLTVEEQSRDIVYGKEKIRVILQFPEATAEMSLIKKEVREILKMELQRQIKNTKGVIYHEESKDAIEGQFQSAVGGGR